MVTAMSEANDRVGLFARVNRGRGMLVYPFFLATGV